jgi:hypothetical protein
MDAVYIMSHAVYGAQPSRRSDPGAVRGAISDGTLPPAMVEGLAFASVNHRIRAADYIRLTGRNAQAATRDFTIAVKGGWLLATGKKRGRYYVPGPRLPSPQIGPAAGSAADA